LLYETDHEFFAKRINLLKGDQNKHDFLKVNPKGRVPALQNPDGFLKETPAILIYIAQIFPEKHLVRSEPFELAMPQSFNMFISSTVHVAHAHKIRGASWAGEKNAQANMTKKVEENMFECASIIKKTI